MPRRDKPGRGYSLGPKLFRLTGRTWSPEQIGEVARPLLEALTHATDEGSSVAVWYDKRVRIAAKQETAGPVRVVQDINAHRPLHCTAVGKALAAWLPPAEVRASLDRNPMVRLTSKTIVDRDAFDDELRRIREPLDTLAQIEVASGENTPA